MAVANPLSSLRTVLQQPSSSGYRSRSHENTEQPVITSTVGPDTGASAARDFYFRPSKKLSKKVCRKFQEAVIGPAAAGQQWPDARHWGLGSENSKYCNKVQFRVLRSSDQVVLM